MCKWAFSFDIFLSFVRFLLSYYLHSRYNKHKGLLNKIQVSDNKYIRKEQKRVKNMRNTMEKRIKLLMPIFVNFDIIKKKYFYKRDRLVTGKEIRVKKLTSLVAS